MVWQFGVLLLIFQLLRLLWRVINKPPQFHEEQQLQPIPFASATLAVAEECKTTIHVIDQILSGHTSISALEEQLHRSEQRLRRDYPGISTEAFEESRKALPLIPPEHMREELTELRQALERNVSAAEDELSQYRETAAPS